MKFCRRLSLSLSRNPGSTAWRPSSWLIRVKWKCWILHIQPVIPFYNGHPGYRVYWPMWRGSHCWEVKIRANLPTGTITCGCCTEVALWGSWPLGSARFNTNSYLDKNTEVIYFIFLFLTMPQHSNRWSMKAMTALFVKSATPMSWLAPNIFLTVIPWLRDFSVLLYYSLSWRGLAAKSQERVGWCMTTQYSLLLLSCC